MRLVTGLGVCLLLVLCLGTLACNSNNTFGPSGPESGPDPDPPGPCDDAGDDCDGNCELSLISTCASQAQFTATRIDLSSDEAYDYLSTAGQEPGAGL